MSVGDPGCFGDKSLLNDPDYQSLIAQASASYPIQTEFVEFGELGYWFTKVKDPADLPLDLNDRGDMLWEPYWAEDWESSRAICRLFIERDFAGTTVLDLGCGLGLTGAVAAQQGSWVTLADNAEPALLFSKINCWNWRDRCQFEMVDWKSPESQLDKFDLIIGAEIIYDKDHWVPLEKFWRTHLAAEGAVFLCDPFRRTGREFRDWIQEKQWRSVFQDFKIPEFEKPVNLIELRLN